MGSSGVNFKLRFPAISISPFNSPNSDGVVCTFSLSAVNTSLSSLYKIKSDIWVLLLFGFLNWTKNVAYLVLIGKSKNAFRLLAVFVNKTLISSI